MLRIAGIISLVLLFCASVMAQDRAALGTETFRASGLEDNKDGIGEFKTNKAGTAAFYTSIAGLWTATALDIQSGNQVDQTRYKEVNLLGSPAGQISTSAITTGAAILLRRYGGRRTRWIATALVAGATAGHAYGAIHNYGLK
jgi:hypothetical protein